MRARSTAGYRLPMASTEPMPSAPAWERRFRAPILSLPAWAADDPERMILARPRAAATSSTRGTGGPASGAR